MPCIEHLKSVLDALPDPVFILSRTGKYVAVYGGKDPRYYHDGSGLVGLKISDLIKPEKANWFVEQIEAALHSRKLHIEEYELGNNDVMGLSGVGPEEPIWFEGRIQALDFLIDGEEVVLWVASNISERNKLENTLRSLSHTDQLTGLLNRRGLAQDLTIHYENFVRHSLPTFIVMFDLDNLKQVNDAFGHHRGDELLKMVADICQERVRKSDMVCRYGGDEFVIVLPNIELSHASQFAERLRTSFQAKLLEYRVNNILATASIGVTSIKTTDKSYEDTLKRADHALYQAKENGRDQVVLE
jgi:two-component system cell cycle response regulator